MGIFCSVGGLFGNVMFSIIMIFVVNSEFVNNIVGSFWSGLFIGKFISFYFCGY